MAGAVMVSVCSYASKESSSHTNDVSVHRVASIDSSYSKVSVNRVASIESSYSAFSEKKFRAEEREFDLAKRLLFEEDPITIECRRQAEEYAKVNKWCKKNGYRDIITPKRTYKGASKFPLHTAVKQQDLDMVKLLIKLGATKDSRNSRGKTASQLAELIVESAMRDDIMDALRV